MRNGPLLQLLLMSDTIHRSTEQALRGDHTDGGGVTVIEERFAGVVLSTPKVDHFGSWWGRPDVPRVRRSVLSPPVELTGPISRVCPRCGAAVGKGCSREGGYRLSSKHRFHKGRTDK